jgi:GGDEF domain-containing protein
MNSVWQPFNPSQLLWLMVALALAIYGAAWLVARLQSNSARVSMAVFNLVMAVALVLIALRSNGPYLVTHTLPNLLILWGFAALTQVLKNMLRLNISTRELMLIMTPGGLGVLAFGFDADMAPWRASVIFSVLGLLLIRISLASWMTHRHGGARRTTLAIAGIGLLAGLAFLARAALSAVSAEQAEIDTGTTVNLLMAYLLLGASLVLNLAAASVVVYQGLSRARAEGFHDPSTGLLNRPGITRTRESVWAQGRKNNTAWACLLVELQHFEQLKELAGRSGTQVLLTRVGAELQSCAPPGTTVGYWDGGIYELVVPACPKGQAMALMGNLQSIVQSMPGLLPDPKALLKVWVGGTGSLAGDPSGRHTMDRAADALRVAKDMGPGGTHFRHTSSGVPV